MLKANQRQNKGIPTLQHKGQTSLKNKRGYLSGSQKKKSEHFKAMAYQTVVQPKLEYDLEIWWVVTRTVIDQIEIAQSMAA